MEDIEKDIVTKKYEVALLAIPTLEEEAAVEYFRTLEKKIQDAGGHIGTPSRPQRIPLAYMIRKFSEGYFGFVLFEAGPAVARALDAIFRQEKNLLRHMLIMNKFGEQPSITDQSVRRREPRPMPAASPASTPAPAPSAAPAARTGHAIDNAELERRLEEILQ
jgi:small subunit ribosomal protein S6